MRDGHGSLGGGGCTRKMEPFVLLAFFLCFIVFVVSKLDISPSKHSVFGMHKGLFWGAEKDMSKDGSIWQLFVLCLLALGDTVPKCYFLL